MDEIESRVASHGSRVMDCGSRVHKPGPFLCRWCLAEL